MKKVGDIAKDVAGRLTKSPSGSTQQNSEKKKSQQPLGRVVRKESTKTKYEPRGKVVRRPM
jgi:hypothetical protein